MSLCPECCGKGSKVQLSYRQNVNGTVIAPSIQFPNENSSTAPNVQVACTQCGGTGITRNFGV